ncbi:zinc-finger homeodomain-containing protein 3 [Citrus sinensis]|uniref:ZF-HD dimerization-type domain-containing protein n=1 Tax=Citrus clementina TaxID=85681 RepID=V4SLC9_CITCL|nr:zinc-finger homeodomain protein 3 [Citrus x clementina]XP_006466561.2 zinc-finger homeodomain protein 3-like [Citrus sinensis]ESR39635.1 hypothetical protein CICLE_v10027184mg [Citrus x clementina]KAH9664610.1 zinc-finger homeodomain-containing protein 3 [Citrus sinensis]
MNSSSSPPKERQFIVLVNSSNSNGNIVVQDHEEEKNPCKKVVRYKECLKNHAAAIGGSATDGCGEFMPSGEEGSIESLKCSACNCHRNFHRKEIGCDAHYHHLHQQAMMMLSGNSGSAHSASDEKVERRGVVVGRPAPADDDDHQKRMMMRKRFRTKFTQEQKEKMLSFAERADWRIQKLDESVVQQFCQEIGIKRRVLKVWMHNNKQSFAKKNSSSFD